jgi:hypothetical protein
MKHSVVAKVDIWIKHPRKNIIVSSAFDDVILTNVPFNTRALLAGLSNMFTSTINVNGIPCLVRQISSTGDVIVRAVNTKRRFLIKPAGKRPAALRQRLEGKR